MSPNIHSRRAAVRAARNRRRLVSRIVTIIVIVLVVAVVGWSIFSSWQQAHPAPTATPTETTTPEPTPTVAIPTAGGPTPQLVGTKQYTAAPPFLLDMTKQYTATVKMANGGEFVILLYADKAPITVNSFVFLARQGFYDGVTFHRVLEGFMAQGGDPLGTGGGGPGYSFVDETNSGLTFDKAGLVAMANAGPNTNGSQFFITYVPTDWLNGLHTIFGEVVSGMDVVNGLTLRDPQQAPAFTGDVIESITITE